VSPVMYKSGFYIAEGGILHSHSRENFKSYIHIYQYSVVFFFKIMTLSARGMHV
jgi:hypothetical protein